MRWGGVWSSSWGAVEDQILHLVCDEISPGNIRARLYPMGRFRSKFYAPFVNGIYQGYNIQAPLIGPLEAVFPLTPGTTLGSIYFEDAGDWTVFNDYIPDGWAQNYDLLTALRLQVNWSGNYSQTEIEGDSQLSAVTVTGAKRGVNVEADEFFSTRGKLSYSITTPYAAVRVLRWYNGPNIVAEGTRSGDGAISCTELNGSGLSIAATLTYSADLTVGTAFLELRWPKNYEIHYSTAALVYPRVAEFTFDDNGSDDYTYLSPILPAGAYNIGLVVIDDDGNKQTAAIPNATKTLYAAPLPPTITSVTGTAYTRTNLLLRSEEFDNATWTKTQLTVSANSIVNPLDGALTADTLVESAANNVHFISQGSLSLATGTDYAASVYVKDNGRRYFGMQLTVASAFAIFDLQLGTVGVSGGADLISADIESVGSGWYRCSVSFGGVTTAIAAVIFQPTAALNFNVYLGDGASGMYVYGAQLEAQDSTSDYIATEGATNSQALVVHWSNGEAGCTYSAYHSNINEPINFGNYAAPAVVTTALNATSANLDAVTGLASENRQTNIDTLLAAFDAAVVACNADFNQTNFAAAFTTMLASLLSAVSTYADAINTNLATFVDLITNAAAMVSNHNASIPTTVSATLWANDMGEVYGDFLSFAGDTLNHTPLRYTLPNGAITSGAAGSETLGIGSADDGSAGDTSGLAQNSLVDMCDPVLLYGKIRIVVRATKGGVQETRDAAYEVEFDEDYAVMNPRPNQAHIDTVTASGLTITVKGAVVNDDLAPTAVTLDLYVVDASLDIDPTSPITSGALPASTLNMQSLSLSYAVGAAGWYKVALMARTSGSRSAVYETKYVYLSDVVPAAVSNFDVKVIRGKGLVSG